MDNGAGCCGVGLYFTGGSIAKTSRRIDKNSTRVALCLWSVCALELDSWAVTHIPGLHPMRQIVMIHPPLQRDMLSSTHYHILCRGHVDHWRFARVIRRNPYFDGEFVQVAAKGHWDCSRKEEQ